MKTLLLALALLGIGDHVRPDPRDCSVCHNKPKAMARLGVVSHGDFRFAHSDSKIVELLLDDLDIYWIEGQHIKLGFAAMDFPMWPGGSSKDDDDKTTTVRSLANGALAMKPYARAHAYLERAEATYLRLQQLLDVEDSDFVPSPRPVGAPPAPYMGEGPYLGQAAKYELLILPGPEQYNAYLTDPDGLNGEFTNRSLVKETDAISVALQLMDGAMWDDTGVWGYMVHYLTHELVAGYKHDSYPTPIWLEAGLAHALEREVNPSANSFCGSAEVAAEGAKLNDWTEAVKKALRGKRRAYLEDLLAKESLADFTLVDHLFAWSMVRFLIDEHPKAFAGINADLHGLSGGKRGVGVTELRVAHQGAFAEHLDMTYPEFDKAWSKWAKRQKEQR